MQVLKKDAPFIHKAIATLAISIVCDILDYIGVSYLRYLLLEMYLMVLQLACYIP